MRTTRIVSLTSPWSTIVQERVSATFGCTVDLFYRRPDTLIVHADISERDLRGVIPSGVPYRVEYSDVVPFRKKASNA